MASVTLNTNHTAMIALQNLMKSNNEMDDVQKRVSTGYKVADAMDDAGVYSVAQSMRADVAAYDAVALSVSRGLNVVNIAIAAAEGISDLLIEMKAKATAAFDPSVSDAQRQMYNEHYQALKNQITTMISSASFDGFNLIDGPRTPPVPPATYSVDDLRVLSEPDANNFILIQHIDFTAITVGTLGSVDTALNAEAELTLIDTAMDNLHRELAVLGGNNAKLESHSEFVIKLQDSLNIGIGAMVDADLGRESARLQALQIKQQLGTQALAIANQRPSLILSLFQG